MERNPFNKLIGYNGELKEKINIYYYNKDRNKCNIPGRTANSMKKKLIEKKGKVCYICNNIFGLANLELEHIIPVEIGGKIFCESNLDLVCSKCHNKKSIIDRKVIRIIKEMKYIFFNQHSFVPLEEIRKLYVEFFKIIKLNNERYQKWYNGNPNEDYEQIIDKSNREVDNER